MFPVTHIVILARYLQGGLHVDEIPPKDSSNYCRMSVTKKKKEKNGTSNDVA